MNPDAAAPSADTAGPPPPVVPAPTAAAPTRIVAIGNQKGGVGKTTTVVNLAACLAEAGYRVLVIDLDPQANATSGLGLGRQLGTSLYNALIGTGDAAACIQSTAVRGCDLIPAELDLAGAEIEVARADNYLHRLRAALDPLRAANRYHFILIDCPPSLGILTMNALAAADSLLVPIQCEYFALEGLSVVHRLISQLRDSQANPGLRLEGIVMTMFDARTKLGTEVVREVNRHFAGSLYDTVIPRNVRLSEAPSHGIPVTQYDPHSSGTLAYRRLAEEFLQRQGLHAPAPLPGTPAPTARRGQPQPRRLPIFRITTISHETPGT